MNRISTSIITSVLLMSGVVLKAQDCRLYFPDKVGATREMKFFDDKGKFTSVSRQEILEKNVAGRDVTIKVRSTTYDTSDQEIFGGELEMMCEGGVFKFDMKSMIDPNTMATYKEMGMDITTDNILYPANLATGQTLPDGNLKMVIRSGQATLMTITVTVSNRKVVSTENITTEAGTFECARLTYDSVVKMGFITISSSAVEWIADGVGIVKTETFNKKGKSTGYSILSKLTR